MRYLLFFILGIVGFIGCSGANPVAPGQLSETLTGNTGYQNQLDAVPADNRHIRGFWLITISDNGESFDIVSARNVAIHLNALKFLEQAPCTDCLGISDISPIPPDKLSVGITIKHPFPGMPNLTGFDVRGILVTGSDYTFPASGKSIAFGDDYPRMLDPDGYTSLYNPVEFPPSLPGPAVLKYISGKLAHEGDFTATLNPFRAYAKDATRRIFESGASENQEITIISPDVGSGALEFGYAVDVSWEKAPGPVVDPAVDFPITANCPEAYRVDIQVGNCVPLSAGGSTPVTVEVYDHQGIETIQSVFVEAPDLFNGEIQLEFSTETLYGSWIYTGMIENSLHAASGEYPILAKVVDTAADTNLGQIDAWQVDTISIKRAWVCTWGITEFANDNTNVQRVKCDSDGNIYIAGSFHYTVDFDPGPGVEERTACGDESADAYVLKIDPTGEYQWVLTWGAESGDYAYDLAIDGQNNIYVAGSFRGTVDFDPGPGEKIFTSSDSYSDAYISKFNPDGNLLWTKVWEGASGYYSISCTFSGDIYAIGMFRGTVDFDPGPGEDWHEAISYSEIFLVKYGPNGAYKWGVNWGAGTSKRANGVDMDELGNVFVCGHFEKSVDFDPGPEEDIHESNNGTPDAFISCFDSAGNYKWAGTWGSDFNLDGDAAYGLAADAEGNVYVTGRYYGSVDFYPGPPTDWNGSNGGFDINLSRYSDTGQYWWTRTWGSTHDEYGTAVATDSNGLVYATGQFYFTADFNEWGAPKLRTSNGAGDVYITVFDKYHTHQWVTSWGGEDTDSGESITIDDFGNIFVVGYYHDDVDFDPGPGEEIRNSDVDGRCFLVKIPPGGEW